MFNYNPYSYNAIPISSIEEAQKAPIDFSGNPVLYFNRSQNEIYLKQFDMTTGKTYFGKYIFTETPAEPSPKDEMKEINEKLDYLYKLLSEKETKPKKEKAVKDDE